MSLPVYDAESLALPEASIRLMLPEWDINEAQERVPKNYKKEDAIKGWLEEDEKNWGRDIIDKAALYPEYSRLVIAGFMAPNGAHLQLMLGDEELDVPRASVKQFSTEEELIEQAFLHLDEDPITGFNIKGWDLPYVIRRAWILGVPVPKSVFHPGSQYQFRSDIDLKEVWCAGVRQDFSKRIKLQDVLKACRLPLKTADGSEFGAIWNRSREEALAYNLNDLRVEMALSIRLGVNESVQVEAEEEVLP